MKSHGHLIKARIPDSLVDENSINENRTCKAETQERDFGKKCGPIPRTSHGINLKNTNKYHADTNSQKPKPGETANVTSEQASLKLRGDQEFQTIEHTLQDDDLTSTGSQARKQRKPLGNTQIVLPKLLKEARLPQMS